MYIVYSMIYQVSDFLSCWFHKVYLCSPLLKNVHLIWNFNQNLQDEGAQEKQVHVGEI